MAIAVGYKSLDVEDARKLRPGDKLRALISFDYPYSPFGEPCIFKRVLGGVIKDEEGKDYLLIKVERQANGKTKWEIGRNYYFGKS